ncbi:MAG: hypothetical protein JSV39_02425 [Candidatus Aenigmatarchaeota archaeon]|nr:MAG: hypothetical protein JSV39_02425 [Candidatus Aenigmarchaeota archaeon]
MFEESKCPIKLDLVYNQLNRDVPILINKTQNTFLCNFYNGRCVYPKKTSDPETSDPEISTCITALNMKNFKM